MIGLIIIPYSFVNGTIADGVKVNSNFSVVTGGINEIAGLLNDCAGSRDSLTSRLAVALNADGTLKATAIPESSYDTRTRRTVAEDDTITEADAVILADTTAGDITLTLPASASASVMPTVLNTGLTGYAVNIVPAGADTIMEQASYVLSVAGEFAQFAVDGTNWWRVR